MDPPLIYNHSREKDNKGKTHNLESLNKLKREMAAMKLRANHLLTISMIEERT